MILLTPVRARFKEDIILRERVLKEYVQNIYPIGFEVILPGGPKGDLNYSQTIVKNLKRYSEDPNFYLTLHHVIERKRLNLKGTDLTEKEGLKILKKILELAKAINARLVNLHTEKFYFGEELLKKPTSLKAKRSLQKKIKEGVEKVKKSLNYLGKISFENVFHALMGDYPAFKTAKKMIFDPLLVTAEDFFHFSNFQQGLGVCLDTCHYGLTKKAINKGLKTKLTRKEIIDLGLFGLPKEDIKFQPNLKFLAKKLGKRLFSVHFSDFKGFWSPGKTCYSEGVVPGEGESEKELLQFLKYIKEKNIPVTLEVKDKDFKKLKETKKVIKWIINNI
jgi:sugar phosphate isomerase/epimerase